MEPSKITNYKIAEPLLLSLMVVLGILLGKRIVASGTPELKSQSKSNPTIYTSSSVLDEAGKYISSRHIDSIELQEIEALSLKTLVKQLDPFSLYLPRHEKLQPDYADFEAAYGFSPTEINKKWFVKSIDPYSAAWKSSLDIGDQLLTINDSANLKAFITRFDDSILLIKTKQENNSKLTRISRSDLIQTSIKQIHRLDQNIGYIKIDFFGDNTYDEFITAIDSLYTKHKIKNYIIDLRDNPGGYMEECSRVLNQFFKEKNILMAYSQGRTIRKVEYRTDGRQLFELGKISVLINDYSASAAEVFAGAIQDLDRGKVIGQHSYGKGLVQEQYMLSNGDALRLSVARFYLPSGRTVDKEGKIIDKNKIFKSKNQKVLHAGSFIYPDVLVEAEKESDRTLQNQIDEYILNLKIQTPNHKDPIKAIQSKMLTTKKKWSVSERKELISLIQKNWNKTLKDPASFVKYHLMAEKEIQAGIDALK